MKFLIALVLTTTIAKARTIDVMSYNVENLFDAKHDKGKKDWTFLPKNSPGKKEACFYEKNKHHRKECLVSDWTENKVDFKIAAIAEVVNDHAQPDFLGLVEVENPEVVNRLAKKLGFDHVEMTESPDERGVDVALLYKTAKDIKLVSRAEHVVPVDYPTRNILEVEFLINDKYPLTIFVNHWPSLSNPDSWRIKAAEILSARTQEILKKNPKMAVIAMGDFNTIEDNNPHPFKTVLFKDKLFSDVEASFIADKSVDEKLKKAKSPGTYYFAPKDEWNSLDHFFVTNNLMDRKDLDVTLKSFEIYSAPFMTHEMKKMIDNQKIVKLVLAPKKFKPEGTTKEAIGYSDHFPIRVLLDYPEPKQHPKKTK
jgi:endonuclease/exonuclease/phosphatase family metal-dependent hydrolase